MTFDSLKKKYFRYWDTEDVPADNTFDKYQRAYYQEKEFDVDVTNGQLNLDFRGENFACSVSAVVIYPVEKAEQGRKFLDYVVEKRRFFFDNYFHRILHKATGDPLAPTRRRHAARLCRLHARLRCRTSTTTTRRARRKSASRSPGFGFAGQYEPLTVEHLPAGGSGQGDVVDQRSDRAGHDSARTISPSATSRIG